MPASRRSRTSQGKKFSAGIRGSGAELLTRQMFQLLGIEPQWSPGSIQDAVEGTQNRQLVGYSKYGVGAGLDATLRELMVSTQMRYLTFDEEQQSAILAKIKGVDFADIPANTIPGQGGRVARPSCSAPIRRGWERWMTPRPSPSPRPSTRTASS